MIRISALVPAYNEEKTISHVLKTLIDSGVFYEIICVNDGSTDYTSTEVKKFKEVIFIDLQTNQGKGYAVNVGVKKATGDFIALVDADLSKLTTEHIKKFVDPVVKGKADVVIAYEDGELLSLFSGERIYKREELLPLLEQMKDSRFGVEVILNSAFNKRKVKHVKLRGLGHLEKLEKHEAKAAVVNFLKQWFVDVLKQYMKSGVTYSEIKTTMNELPKYLSKKSKKHKIIKKR